MLILAGRLELRHGYMNQGAIRRLGFLQLRHFARKADQPEQPAKFLKSKGLPSKICLCCGRPMVWRKSWSKNWDEIKYCSEKCRRSK